MTHHRVAIIGSGFSGLGMAVRLKQAGIHDFVILERAADLGGTWRDNTYPGCQCDVESNLYSYSFAPNPTWSRTYSPQAEIWDYLRLCAEKFELGPHLRYRHEVHSARWDHESARWQVESSGGQFSADVLVVAVGPLSEPSLPAIEGLGGFRGPHFHSAAWDHDIDLTGKRVAVVGTGASAIQLVPRIQPQVARLYLFQRTPPWVLPHRDREVRGIARTLYRTVPGLQRLVRSSVYWTRELFVIPLMKVRPNSAPEQFARRHLEKQVADPGLRARLTPRYAVGCKRILISNEYYPAIQRANVELVTDDIREIRGRSIVTADGAEREVDVIVLATGFRVTEMPFARRVSGRDGKNLADQWSGSPAAYRGTAVAGFPNLFLLLGPNTGLGHTSVLVMLEAQLRYVMSCLGHLEHSGMAAIEVRPEAQEAFNADVQSRLRDTVWNSGGCRSWYLTPAGKNTTIWPGMTWPYVRLLRRFDPAAYHLSRRPA
ncbi:MAG TPA: NAD(P)/FAD-dependent oxidoreductase [Candidatus Dormibacteraeota bacterium]|nr:NAD(P)/FAD-dependent oxidoreductase [Candidatus Dormibacteraeota bacterium]